MLLPFSVKKDPDAVLDYSINWAEWLDGGGPVPFSDTISASEWTADSGITIESKTVDGTYTTVWLSGGTAGQSYNVTNHITTPLGREEDRSLLIYVQER